MGGFNTVRGDETIGFADNFSFDGTERGGKLTTNGQLWIGRTASPHVKRGTVTSPDASITIGYVDPNITLITGPAVPTIFQTDSGNAVPAGNTIIIAGGTGIDTSGAGNTVTITFDVTEVPTIPTSITTDDGTVTPAANNFSILGRSGSKVGASGAIVTVRSPPYADQGGSTTVTLNSGSFATAGVTLTTPATAGLLDGDLIEFVATNGILVVQMNTAQVGHLGTAVTSSGGTFTGSATGDSLSLRWKSSTSEWWATSAVGVWVLA